MECIAKKKGWAKEDGSIDQAVVAAEMAAANKSEEWDVLVTQAQEKCFSELPSTSGMYLFLLILSVLFNSQNTA